VGLQRARMGRGRRRGGGRRDTCVGIVAVVAATAAVGVAHQHERGAHCCNPVDWPLALRNIIISREKRALLGSCSSTNKSIIRIVEIEFS